MFRLLILFASLITFEYLAAQGCSDAGACSIESLNFDETSKDSKLRLNLEQTFGLGEKFVFISQTTAGFQYKFGATTLFELRVPFIFTLGNLGHTSGVGDLIISVNQRIKKNDYFGLSIILASRIKSNDADKYNDEQALPMAYQTSLGTYDIILGSLLSIPNWDFYAAWQHSFGRNKNNYLISDPTIPENKQYYESNKLKRGDDLFFRSRRFFNLKNGNRIISNALVIYRLNKDEIIKNGQSLKLDGSTGLTINLSLTYSKIIKENRKLDFYVAFPIIDRQYRADGLTRNVVLGIRLINL